MMFRKEVLTALFTTEIREHKNSVDTYLATGSNFMGGTLVYTKPLTQRLIHSKNDYRAQAILAQGEYQGHYHLLNEKYDCLIVLMISIIENGYWNHFGKRHFLRILTSLYSIKSIQDIRSYSITTQKKIPWKFVYKLMFNRMIDRLKGQRINKIV